MNLQILQLTIVSPERTLFEGSVESVTLPGEVGSFTLLPQHAPLISSLQKGTISYTVKAGTKEVEITGGFVEIENDLIRVCVEL